MVTNDHGDLDDGEDHVGHGHNDAGHCHDDADEVAELLIPVRSRVKLGGSLDDASSASLPSHSTMMQKVSS